METLTIIGKNAFETWSSTRTVCRGVVLRGDELLLAYEAVTGQWMIPGGGQEPGEDEAACCVREIGEETGVLVEAGPCALEIDEYYEAWRYVSRYFLCKAVGRTAVRLTDREREAGMTPRWLSVARAIEIFSHHQDYAATDEMRRGMYLREYTALRRLMG